MLSAAFAALLAVQVAQQTNVGIVQGVVTRTGTSEPLPFVQVVLVAGYLAPGLTGRATAFSDALTARTRNDTPATTDTPGPFATTTDSEGRFSFSGIAPGQYTVRAQREGYFATPAFAEPTAGATAPITVVAQQPVTPVALSLMAGGVVSGRIRDPGGQPVPRINITAYKVVYMEGRAVIVSEKSLSTDDRGEYRMSWLPPGDYYFATPRPGLPRGLNDSWARTFFPSTADTLLARPVTVIPGGEVPGIDITIQAVPDVRISGRVIPADVNANTLNVAYSFSLVPRDPNVLIENLPASVQNSATDRTGDRFEFRGIFPGSYDLVVDDPTGASSGFPSRPLRSGRVRVDVGSKDVIDVTVVLHPTVELKGTIRVDGSKAPLPFQPFGLSLQDIYSVIVTGNYAATVDRSGSFVIPNVPVGAYRFKGSAGSPSSAFNLPSDAYVFDIVQGGRSVYDSGIVVGPEVPDDIQVTVRMDGGSVNGNVVDADQKLFKGARVALVPQGTRRQNGTLYRATFGGDDHFSFRGIAPGQYKLFAWESLPLYTAYQDETILTKAETRGQFVNIQAGIATAAQVRVIPK